jgi:Holliday junction resolvase
MPNKRYIAGRNFEYKVKKELEKMGYFVTRASASKGLFDLVAIKIDKELAFISIEFWQLKKGITQKQAINLLREIQKMFFGEKYFPILTEKSKNKYKSFIDFFFNGETITIYEPRIDGKITLGVIYSLPKKKKLDKKIV